MLKRFHFACENSQPSLLRGNPGECRSSEAFNLIHYDPIVDRFLAGTGNRWTESGEFFPLAHSPHDSEREAHSEDSLAYYQEHAAELGT